MSIFSSIGRMASDYRAARTRYRTERAIRALPIELQKDIGWPEPDDMEKCFPYGIGSWAGSK
jgi:hypothetical protein